MKETVVIKIGGSLLSEPGVFDRIGTWLDATRQEGQTRLILAGGGQAVDALRTIDAANPLPSDATHDAAIAIMDTHTRLLPLWLPGLAVTSQLPANAAAAVDCAFVCGPFLRQTEPHRDGERLSIGWESTSDAIAARIAEIVQGRLVLLKHTLHPTENQLPTASRAGVVDAETSRHAAAVGSVELIGIIRPGLPG